jgi:hypothetical protein
MQYLGHCDFAYQFFFVLRRDTQLIVHFIQCLSGWTSTGLKTPTGKEVVKGLISFPLLKQNETAQDLVLSLGLSVINLIPIFAVCVIKAHTPKFPCVSIEPHQASLSLLGFLMFSGVTSFIRSA